MAGTLAIRAAVPDDLAAVDAMLAQAYPRLLKADYPPSALVTALPLISRARPDLLACGTYFLALDENGAVLGAGGWTEARHDGRLRRVGSVRHVVTHHDHVRRGIGRAVMEHVLATAHAAGLSRLQCLSTRTAVPFYRAMGFGRVGIGETEITLAAGIVFPVVRMARQL